MISDNHDLSIDLLRDIVQDAHLNFLLGAGASAQMFSLLGDVENVLTSIERSNVGLQAKRRAKAAVYGSFFNSVVFKNTELLDRAEGAAGLLESYGAFLQTVNRILLRRRSSIINKQVNLFTTNVDLAVEVAAEELQLELNDGFSGRFNPRFSTTNFGSVLSRRSLQYDNLSEIPTFNLLKLHGSVGWRTNNRLVGDSEARPEIVFDATLDLVRSVNESLIAVTDSVLEFNWNTSAEALLDADAPPGDADIEGFLEAYEELAIVNPTKEKFKQTVLSQNYYDLLRLFSNDLEKENSVLFVIGFSCRDEHIRELMVRAARTNPTLQIVIFAFKPDCISEITNMFDGYHVSNGNIRVVGPATAEAGGAAERYDLLTITRKFFEPLVPRPPRKPDATVSVNVALQEPLVSGDE